MNNRRKIKVENRKQFDFSEVGKRTPYRSPEGFFAEQEQALKKIVSSQKSVVRPLRRKWFYAAVASIILIGGIYGVSRLLMHPSTGSSLYATDSAPVYSQTSSASDDWSDFAEADMFLDNMNW
jgi:hypothetical protein